MTTFTTRPTEAMININLPFTGSGWSRRCTASYTSTPVRPQMRNTLPSAPRISARWKPKLRSVVASLEVIHRANTLIRNPARSDRR
jgi:hypothetical protein